MVRLQSCDYESVLDFLADVAGLDSDEPYPAELLLRLQDLVRCDEITYQDCDLQAKRFLDATGADAEADDGDDVYWSTGPCPISEFRTRTHDVRVVTMSDVIGRQSWHDLPVFREYFAPAGLDHMVDLALLLEPPRLRSIVLFRALGASDFSERDRSVLELLRPHLQARETHAALRRRLEQALRNIDDAVACDPYAGLTAREREIVELVAEGKTNAQIAAQLWVAPSTVKKHLEHVYAKLGVGRRTAAATLLRPARLPRRQAESRDSLSMAASMSPAPAPPRAR